MEALNANEEKLMVAMNTRKMKNTCFRVLGSPMVIIDSYAQPLQKISSLPGEGRTFEPHAKKVGIKELVCKFPRYPYFVG